MSWWVGAAVGYWFRKKRMTAQALAEAEATADGLQGRTIAAPRTPETWFAEQGKFMFGMPRSFVQGDPSVWSGPRPAALVVDGTNAAGMWLVVVRGQNMTMELDRGRSPWIVIAQPDAFRAMARKWGGTVVAGPEPIFLDGEQALWASYGMIEGGRENRKWVVFASHRGEAFELIMGLEPHMESTYADAFWTAVGSWQWADHRPTAPEHDREVSAGPARPAGTRLISPDGKHWWDGTEWRPV